jgi:hypothetical protein
MSATVQRHGRYTMFETPNGNRILALGENLWFAWVTGDQGELLVRSDSDHERDRTIQEGEYYLVDFENDESFTGVPHLFLEENDAFREIILPNGLPTESDTQKRVVGTEKAIARNELERQLAASTGAVSPEMPVSSGGDRELPIPDYDELSVRGAKVRLDALTADQLRRLREHESENKKRKTLIHEIDRRLR